jgi:hypothetical protein
MLRKTMIVLAKAAALTSGLTVDAFAHGGSRGHGGGFGGGGHMGGFGGGRIVADLALALRVHILGRRLGWRCLVLFSRLRRQSRRRRRAGPQSLHVRRVDSVCEIHSRSRANRQLSHGQPRAHLAVLSGVARTRKLTGSLPATETVPASKAQSRTKWVSLCQPQ